jgi:hypothetical protein
VKTTTIEKPGETRQEAREEGPGAGRPEGAGCAEGKAKGKTAAAPQNAPANGSAAMPRAGSKNEIMLKMALRPEGATEQAICKKLGWQRCRVTLRRVCAKAGATLTSEGTGEDRVYKAVLPAAADEAANRRGSSFADFQPRRAAVRTFRAAARRLLRVIALGLS